jgi:hypothetical protein
MNVRQRARNCDRARKQLASAESGRTCRRPVFRGVAIRTAGPVPTQASEGILLLLSFVIQAVRHNSNLSAMTRDG